MIKMMTKKKNSRRLRRPLSQQLLEMMIMATACRKAFEFLKVFEKIGGRLRRVTRRIHTPPLC